MKTLKEVLAEIDAEQIKGNDDEATTSNKILTCGATHIAQDADGEYYAYRGEPMALTTNEWGAGNGKDNRCMLYCGHGDKPKDHTVCVWELP